MSKNRQQIQKIMDGERSDLHFLRPVQLVTMTKQDLENALNRREMLIRVDAGKRMDTLTAYHEMNYLIQRIDLIAIYAPVRDKVQLLEGCSTELTAAYELLIKEARLIGINVPELYPDSHRNISRRIDALQIVSVDKGQRLIDVIAGAPGAIGSLATEAKDKIRQGGGAYSKNRRLFVLIEEQRRFTRGWDDTMTNIIKRLNQHSNNPENPDDPVILSDLLKKRADGGPAGLKDYGHDVYHGYKRTKDYERWINTDEYKLWKKSW